MRHNNLEHRPGSNIWDDALKDMMHEIAPERRAEIEAEASRLTANCHRNIGLADAMDAELRPSLALAVDIKARTGQPCPESGLWRVEGNPTATAPIRIDDAMPPHAGRAVTWLLVQGA